MSDQDDEKVEPLDPGLAPFVTALRTRSGAPADGKERVRARLSRSIGGGGAPPAPPAGGGGPPSSLARWAAVFLGGAIAGGGLVYAVAPREIVVPAPPVAVAPAPGPSVVSVPRIDPLAPEPPIASAVPSAVPRPSASTTGDTLEAERVLLDPARTAIGRHDGASALTAVAKHEKQFPKGVLTEEREAIAIQALVQVGRGEEARSRGKRFLERYPGSVLVPAVQAAIDSAR